MKVFGLLLLVAFVSADLSSQRQSSLDALSKLRASIPDFQYAQDSAILRVSEAKQKASDSLNNFYHDVFATKTNSLQAILAEEVETIAYGESVDPWCWESNVPMLEGIMGWAGNDFSDCIKKLDDSLGEVVAKVYGRFQDDEANIKKYTLLEVFQKRNIINNPQSIIDAIGNLKFEVNDAVPEFDSVMLEFNTALDSKRAMYSSCLDNKINLRKQLIDELKAETERCLSSL
ncbi:uncharacterized protein LOC131678436 [Topomyia yanbarensis]|uniref:uncharacterized protein LOC131678436 n=1 Tax=Topomyia yanbarensis TaxID=2498891 RepID=UPI00273B4865|nr:uncharacterized protein LOC131678436 [Topomyia yanbarensis]